MISARSQAGSLRASCVRVALSMAQTRSFHLPNATLCRSPLLRFLRRSFTSGLSEAVVPRPCRQPARVSSSQAMPSKTTIPASRFRLGSPGGLSMSAVINAKELRTSLPEVVEQIRRGVRFTVLYRSRPAFQVVPVDAAAGPCGDLQDDPLYRARAPERSTDGRSAAGHDALLYRA